jgi:hypothetical protein
MPFFQSLVEIGLASGCGRSPLIALPVAAGAEIGWIPREKVLIEAHALTIYQKMTNNHYFN